MLASLIEIVKLPYGVIRNFFFYTQVNTFTLGSCLCLKHEKMQIDFLN